MKIYLDAMGGDNAPQAPAEGAREALERYEGLEIELAGPIEQVKAAVDAAFQGADPALRTRLVLTDCPEVITNCEAPVMAVRRKKQSAIVDGMLKLRDGKVDAFVSAGSTGRGALRRHVPPGPPARYSTARPLRRFCPTARATSCSSTAGRMWTAAPNTCTSSP